MTVNRAGKATACDGSRCAAYVHSCSPCSFLEHCTRAIRSCPHGPSLSLFHSYSAVSQFGATVPYGYVSALFRTVATDNRHRISLKSSLGCLVNY